MAKKVELETKIFDLTLDDLPAVETALNEWLAGKDIYRIMDITGYSVLHLLIFFKK